MESTSRCWTGARYRAQRRGWGRATSCAPTRRSDPSSRSRSRGSRSTTSSRSAWATQARIRRKGALVVHRGEQTWAAEPARIERLRAAGVQGRLLDLAETRAMEPQLTGALAGASFFPADLQCAPRAIARALAGALPRVQTGLEVHGVEVEQDRVTALRTSEGSLACGAVVIAAGPWSRAAGRGGGRRAPARAAQGPARAPGRGAARRALHPPQGGRGGLSGLGRERRRGPAGHDGARDDVGGRRARGLEPRAPRLRPLRRRRRQRRHARAGLRAHARPARARGSTPPGPGCARGCPITCPPSGPAGAVAGLWLATGHEGAGVALGPVTGRLVAQLYAGEAPIVDPAPFSPDRF